MDDRTRILSFKGTSQEFLDYLHRWPTAKWPNLGELSESEVYEWEITASMSRHPAGKKIGRG